MNKFKLQIKQIFTKKPHNQTFKEILIKNNILDDCYSLLKEYKMFDNNLYSLILFAYYDYDFIICPVCKNHIPYKYYSRLKQNNNKITFCSLHCKKSKEGQALLQNKREKTNINKYGNKIASKTDLIKLNYHN